MTDMSRNPDKWLQSSLASMYTPVCPREHHAVLSRIYVRISKNNRTCIRIDVFTIRFIMYTAVSRSELKIPRIYTIYRHTGINRDIFLITVYFLSCWAHELRTTPLYFLAYTSSSYIRGALTQFIKINTPRGNDISALIFPNETWPVTASKKTQYRNIIKNRLHFESCDRIICIHLGARIKRAVYLSETRRYNYAKRNPRNRSVNERENFIDQIKGRNSSNSY